MNKFSPIPVYSFEEQQLDPPVNIFTIEELRHNLDTCPIYRDSFYTVYLVVEGNEELSSTSVGFSELSYSIRFYLPRKEAADV